MKSILIFFLGSLAISAYVGYDLGQDSQKAKDQVIFDQVNQERADQKEQASKMLASLNQQIIEAQAETAKFKNQLEKQRAQSNETVNNLRAQYASASLYIPASQSAGDRGGSGSTSGSQGDTTGANGATNIQLPDSIAADLRQLVYEADKLAVEYETCYNYINR